MVFGEHSAPASRSALAPGDYYFAWARDGALSMNAYLQTKPFPQSDEKMEKWIQSLEKAQHESDPNGIDAPDAENDGMAKKNYQ